MRPFFSFPFMVLALVGLVFGLIFFFILIQVGLVTVAFTKIGLTPGQALLILIATLFGSGINMPFFRTGRTVRVPVGPRRLFMDSRGYMQASPQEMELQDQVVAVNFGGCIIPCLLSLMVVGQIGVSFGLGLAVAGVVAVCYAVARPMPGRGIGIPMLVPPLVAALCAIIFAPEGQSAHVAYVAGSIGTLLGADVLHLWDRRMLDKLDAPLLSIGGAGTFDGIFVTGIVAVLLA
ncbi:hypothetical protein JCM16814_21370 [Desulfobaculum senezii]|jgi:uncharacterized membrane protein